MKLKPVVTTSDFYASCPPAYINQSHLEALEELLAERNYLYEKTEELKSGKLSTLVLSSGAFLVGLMIGAAI